MGNEENGNGPDLVGFTTAQLIQPHCIYLWTRCEHGHVTAGTNVKNVDYHGSGTRLGLHVHMTMATNSDIRQNTSLTESPISKQYLIETHTAPAIKQFPFFSSCQRTMAKVYQQACAKENQPQGPIATHTTHMRTENNWLLVDIQLSCY
jgi:hypothetical protein